MPSLLLCVRGCGSTRGHEFAERLAELGFGDADSGRLYRVLREMEREDLVASEDGSVDGSAEQPAGRRYEITASGEKRLELWAGAFEKYYTEVDHFLRLYNGGPVRQNSLT